MRFIGAGGRTLARAVEQSAGCPSVRLTIDGRTGPLLSDYPSVTDALIRLGAVPVAIRASRVGAATVRQEGLSASAVLDPGQAAQFGLSYTRCRGAVAVAVGSL